MSHFFSPQNPLWGHVSIDQKTSQLALLWSFHHFWIAPSSGEFGGYSDLKTHNGEVQHFLLEMKFITGKLFLRFVCLFVFLLISSVGLTQRMRKDGEVRSTSADLKPLECPLKPIDKLESWRFAYPWIRPPCWASALVALWNWLGSLSGLTHNKLQALQSKIVSFMYSWMILGLKFIPWKPRFTNPQAPLHLPKKWTREPDWPVIVLFPLPTGTDSEMGVSIRSMTSLDLSL